MSGRPILQYFLFCEDFQPRTPTRDPLNFRNVVCKYLLGDLPARANFYVVMGFINWKGNHECFIRAHFKKYPYRILQTDPVKIHGEDPYLIQLVAFPLNLVIQEPDIFEVQVYIDGKPEKPPFPLSFVRP